MTTTSTSSSSPSSLPSHSHARHNHRGLYERFHHGHFLPPLKKRAANNAAMDDARHRQQAIPENEGATDRLLHRRSQTTTDPSAPHVTEVVQTVSVVQYIDGSGSAVSLHTLNPPTTTPDTALPFTTQPAASSGPAALVPNTQSTTGTGTTNTAVVPAGSSTEKPSTSSSATLSNGSPAQQAPSSTLSTAQTPATNGTTTAKGALPLTTPIAGTGGVLPGGALNGTATLHLFGNSTLNSSSLHNTLFVKSTRTSSTHLSSSTLFSSSLLVSSSLSSSTLSLEPSTISAEATATNTGDGVAGGGADGTQSGTAATESATGSAGGDSTTPPTSVLVGGVVGGVAGLAVLVLVAMLLMKWKRQRTRAGHRLLDAGTDSLPAGSGGDGGHGGGGMVDLRTAFLLPFAAKPKRLLLRDSEVTSAAAAAAGGAAASQDAGAERGFYRVSGKKLPSVLAHGGDGYEDPRASLRSDGAVVHRDSQGFFGGAGGPSTTPTSRYAVGSPMRPESGVPVFQAGPGRAVAPLRLPLARQGSYIHDGSGSGGSQGGYDDDDDGDAPASTWAPSTTSRRSVPVSPLSPPPPLGLGLGLDPVGRSRASQDGSRGSGSRFTEVIR